MQERFGIPLLILLSMIALFWLRPGYIIAKGDYFPLWLNPETTFSTDAYLWTREGMGSANTVSSFLLDEIPLLFLKSLGLSTELVQILLQVFLLLGAGLSMYFLSATVYSKLGLSSLVSSVFYMFNFFVLQTRLDVGLAWTYVFLPLLAGLLIRVVEATSARQDARANKNIICFAVISTIALSMASINPANVVLVFFVLAGTITYWLVARRNQIRLIMPNIGKLVMVSILLNLWWTIPILNYYFWSPSTSNPQVSVTAWSWTHGRASLLNLFRLNGGWGWSSQYFPYYDSYFNPVLTVLAFVPFLLAGVALLFKSNKSRFNAYIMLLILAFMVLAKGLHEPFGQLNLLLYTVIPSMGMFREPVSKFTMAIMPFLALLIGYAVGHIANLEIGRVKHASFARTLTAAFFIGAFVVAAYPMVTNPIETKTQQLPFSPYIKIPDYWYEATYWINNQSGDYKILITPPDDFYQMPYVWGYYGREFLTRFIQKPILSNSYSYSYETNPDITVTLQQLRDSIKYNRTDEFKALLDLLNIRYILQRNDIQYNFTGRNIISPSDMQAFLTEQPDIRLSRKLGQLDIYEYIDPKPPIYVMNPATLQRGTIRIEKITTLERAWSFTSLTDVLAWQNATHPDQWQINYTITQDNSTLKAEMWNSTWGWKTISSPTLLAQYGNTYQVQADIKGQNAHEVHTKIAEYDENKSILTATYAAYVDDGTFNWTRIDFKFEPTNKTTKYVQIQIWHGDETPKPFPNIVWVDNVQITGYNMILNTTDLDLIFPNTTQNQPATILDYQQVKPTKITATLNATQPFILAVSEALDPSWTAYINGKQYKPTNLYLCIKGFYINQTGMLDVVIEYEPQKWFYYGSIISLTTFLACTTYLTYTYLKTKNIPTKIKNKLQHLTHLKSKSAT